MGFLDGLPKKRFGGRSHEVGRAVLLGWVVAIVASIVAVLLGAPLAGGLTFFSMFGLHFVGVIAGALLQSRARGLLRQAEAVAVRDPAGALDRARNALVIGLPGAEPSLRAWLLVAQCAEEAGALADAGEALRRGLDRGGAHVPRELFVHAHLLWAFVKAALGDLDGAERSLGTFGAVDLANPLLYAEYMRAKAMLLYRRGAFREVVDVANEAFGRAAIRTKRDAALYASLRHSAMLRLDGGHPMRAAHDAPEEAWLESVAPELVTRRAT
jgi:hypothetical protein